MRNYLLILSYCFFFSSCIYHTPEKLPKFETEASIDIASLPSFAALQDTITAISCQPSYQASHIEIVITIPDGKIIHIPVLASFCETGSEVLKIKERNIYTPKQIGGIDTKGVVNFLRNKGQWDTKSESPQKAIVVLDYPPLTSIDDTQRALLLLWSSYKYLWKTEAEHLFGVGLEHLTDEELQQIADNYPIHIKIKEKNAYI